MRANQASWRRREDVWKKARTYDVFKMPVKRFLCAKVLMTRIQRWRKRFFLSNTVLDIKKILNVSEFWFPMHLFINIYVCFKKMEKLLWRIKVRKLIKWNEMLQWKLFKNDEKCFLFRLKSYFRFQAIHVFLLTLCSRRKIDLIKKIRLTSKFLTSQSG